MLDKLPTELKLLLLSEEKHLLKYVNKEFYKLHNLVIKEQVSHVIPIDTINYPLFKAYQNTLRFFNGALSDMLLPEINYNMYYAFLKNRKIFFESKDCQIQAIDDTETSNEVAYEFNNGSLKLNKVQSFLYQKTIKIPSGIYNFELVLINHRFCRGLGTTSFTIRDNLTNEIFQFYPTIYFHEFMPINGINIVNLGVLEFQGDNVKEISIVIEETGLYPKLNLEFLYFQFNPLVNHLNNDYLFYTIDKEDNILERLNYLSIQGVNIIPKNDYIELIDEDYEKYYTSGERWLKMLFPSDQKKFKEKKQRIPIKPWKIPF